VGEAPEVFQIGADGKVEAKMAELMIGGAPAALEARVRAAAKYCPTRSIRIEEK
jgi:ferredoxin